MIGTSRGFFCLFFCVAGSERHVRNQAKRNTSAACSSREPTQKKHQNITTRWKKSHRKITGSKDRKIIRPQDHEIARTSRDGPGRQRTAPRAARSLPANVLQRLPPYRAVTAAAVTAAAVTTAAVTAAGTTLVFPFYVSSGPKKPIIAKTEKTEIAPPFAFSRLSRGWCRA